MIVSPDNTFTIEQIVDIIIKKLKFDGKVIFDKTKPEGIMKKNSSNEMFKKHFNNFKFTPIEEGLESTVEYFIKNYENLRK
jgi:GDP-L-fucose synthase